MTTTTSPTERASLVALIDGAADRWAGRPFVDVVGERWTYADAPRHVRRYGHALALTGLAPGDRVATLLDNSIDAVGVWLGATLIGAVEVPINTAYRGEFLRHQLRDSGASVVVVDAGYLAQLLPVLEGIEDLRTVVVRQGGPDPATTTLESLLAAADADRIPLHTPGPGELALLAYTSGTTGPSKGCMLSHAYLLHAAARLARALERDERTVLYTPNPLYHVNAKLFAVLGTMVTGGSAAVDLRFSVSGFWSEVNRVGATTASLVGAMLPLLAQAPPAEDEERNTTLEIVFGAPFTPELVTTYERRFGVRCLQSVYGLTEAAPLTSLAPGEPARPGSSGRADDGFEIAVFDDLDRPVPPHTVGEVVARPRAPHVMFDGYWGRPAETLDAFRQLWFHTGDLGRLDEDGYFYFVDRKSDSLRRRGENISSFEMERAFAAHPDLAEVAVHAVPSELGEDEVKVTAVRVAGSGLTEESLTRWSLDKVPYFAVPRYVEFRAELPKNPLQRVLKYQLRAEGVTEQTWDRETSDIDVRRGG